MAFVDFVAAAFHTLTEHFDVLDYFGTYQLIIQTLLKDLVRGILTKVKGYLDSPYFLKSQSSICKKFFELFFSLVLNNNSN